MIVIIPTWAHRCSKARYGRGNTGFAQQVAAVANISHLVGKDRHLHPPSL